MRKTLETLRARREEQDRGFTLIELLVVVVIIGILVGIAIPLYLNYRKGAENKSAESDVRGVISAAEQFYTNNANAYPATKTGMVGPSATLGAAGTTTQSVTISSGNTVDFTNNTTSYVICGLNTDGGQVYVYNSANGGGVVKSTQATLAACDSNGN